MESKLIIYNGMAVAFRLGLMNPGRSWQNQEMMGHIPLLAAHNFMSSTRENPPSTQINICASWLSAEYVISHPGANRRSYIR
jgi:hypothetical protein